MNYLHRLFWVASAAFFIAGTALAQQTGTVTSNAFAVGQGPGTTGFASVLCSQAQIAIGQNAAKPICAALSGDMTMNAAGVATVGATIPRLANDNVFTGVNTFKSTQIDANSDLLIGTANVPKSPANATSALQAALNTTKHLVLPCGVFVISAKLQFGLAGQTLTGCGREGTILQFWTGSANFVVETTVADTLMSDLTIDVNSSAGVTQGCANAVGAPRTKWFRVGCINLPNSSSSTAGGFAFISTSNTLATGSTFSQLRDCYIYNMQTSNSAYNAHAVEISYSAFTSVTGCTGQYVDNGVNVSASNNVVVSNNVWIGNGPASPTSFPGVRCANTSIQLTITGNTIVDMPRGLMFLGCQNSVATGNTIKNSRYEAIWFGSTNVPANGTPTQGNIASNNVIQDTCTSNTCSSAILISQSGGSTSYNQASNNVYLSIGTPPAVTMVTLSGVGGGTNSCTNNYANVTIGGC